MNIQDYFKLSWFSTLAYVDWRNESINSVDPTPAIEDANKAERVPGNTVLTPNVDTLGEKIFQSTARGGEGWQIANFQPNDAAGFAASLFVKSDTGEKVLAIRGTEPKGDQALTDLLVADLQEIGEYGMAISQAVSLFNYVQRLLAAADDTHVEQLTLRISRIPPNPSQHTGDYVTAWGVPPQFISVQKTYDGVGLGEQLNYGDNVTITGHSLGGHLANIGTRLFPSLFKDAVTFNAPGFDADAGVANFPIGPAFVSLGKKLTDSFITTLFAPNLVDAPASSFAALNGRLYSMVSEDGVPGNDNSVVASWITGQAASTRLPITTERNSHMVEPIMDALAVQSLFSLLDDRVDLAAASTLFMAAASEPGESEENLLNALDKLLLNDDPSQYVKDIGALGWINPNTVHIA